MVLFLYSDKNCEHQAINCIKSFEHKITDDVIILYYTIGFKSQFECKNLRKIKIDLKDYPTFHYYKAELSLITLKLYPKEKYFVFSDTDILYSKRFDFEKLKHDYSYPLASYGPHEYPFMYDIVDGERIIFDEVELMNYFNVSQRSMRYVWSCFYTFNQNCLEFFEEYTSICQNKYLLNRRKRFFPFHDETPFNVLLWKNNFVNNLGFSFVNTHNPNTVKKVEELALNQIYTGDNYDALGANWEHVYESSNVIFYHGFKDKKDGESALKYIISNIL